MNQENIKKDETSGNNNSDTTLQEGKKDDEVIKLVMRQTDYDEITALNKLLEHNNNVEDIIREYMGVSMKPTETQQPTTTNQMIYSQFRNFLDDASRNHRIKEEEGKQ